MEHELALSLNNNIIAQAFARLKASNKSLLKQSQTLQLAEIPAIPFRG